MPTTPPAPDGEQADKDTPAQARERASAGEECSAVELQREHEEHES
jgi:hypothetical protein